MEAWRPYHIVPLDEVDIFDLSADAIEAALETTNLLYRLITGEYHG